MVRVVLSDGMAESCRDALWHMVTYWEEREASCTEHEQAEEKMAHDAAASWRRSFHDFDAALEAGEEQ